MRAGVEIGMGLMTAEDARKPFSLATSPVPLETAIAALRRFPGVLLLHDDPRFLAMLPNTLLRGFIEPVGQTPVEATGERPSSSRLDVPELFENRARQCVTN